MKKIQDERYSARFNPERNSTKNTSNDVQEKSHSDKFEIPDSNSGLIRFT
jgi:hypothetical protein